MIETPRNKENFGLGISGKQVEANGHVLLADHEEFTIGLFNNSGRRAQATLTVNGKHCGVFVLCNGATYIERPGQSDRRFRFETFETGDAKRFAYKDQQDNGLIECVFEAEAEGNLISKAGMMSSRGITRNRRQGAIGLGSQSGQKMTQVAALRGDGHLVRISIRCVGGLPDVIAIPQYDPPLPRR